MSSSMQRKRATRQPRGLAAASRSSLAIIYSLALRIPARPPFEDDVRRTLSRIISDNRVWARKGDGIIREV